MKWKEYNEKMRRKVKIEEVGDVGIYLIQEMQSQVKGEVKNEERGYNVIGMKEVEEKDIQVVKE